MGMEKDGKAEVHRAMAAKELAAERELAKREEERHYERRESGGHTPLPPDLLDERWSHRIETIRFAAAVANGFLVTLMFIFFMWMLYSGSGLYPARPYELQSTLRGMFIEGDNNNYGVENWKFTDIANSGDYWSWFENRLLASLFPDAMPSYSALATTTANAEYTFNGHFVLEAMTVRTVRVTSDTKEYTDGDAEKTAPFGLDRYRTQTTVNLCTADKGSTMYTTLTACDPDARFECDDALANATVAAQKVRERSIGLRITDLYNALNGDSSLVCADTPDTTVPSCTNLTAAATQCRDHAIASRCQRSCGRCAMSVNELLAANCQAGSMVYSTAYCDQLTRAKTRLQDRLADLEIEATQRERLVLYGKVLKTSPYDTRIVKQAMTAYCNAVQNWAQCLKTARARI